MRFFFDRCYSTWLTARRRNEFALFLRRLQGKWLLGKEQFGQNRQPAVDLFFRGVTEVKADGAAGRRFSGIKALAGHEGHAPLNGLGQDGSGIDLVGQFDPEKQSAGRHLPMGMAMKMAFQRGGKYVALSAVKGDHLGNSFVMAGMLQLFQHEPLADAIAV